MNEQLLEELYKKWGRTALNLHILSLEAGRSVDDPTERKMQQYVLSSSNRDRFISYLQRATFENEWLTIQDLVQLIHCNRGTIETMIKDVEAYGVLDIKRDEKNVRYLKASEKLMSYYHNYTKWLFKIMTEKGGMSSARATATAILELENTVQ